MSKPVIDIGSRGIPATGNANAPAIQIAAWYPFQSYFDSTLGARAILTQQQGQQIVPSTLRTENIAGYAIGLHPSSQTPVAVRFKKGGQAGDSGVIIVKPGQVIRPNGLGPDGANGRFSGFDYGLPYGWLGGGSATLVVFRSPDSTVDWLDRSELIYHRMRLPILQPAAVPAAASLVPNWPISFPWESAARGADAIPQQGEPIIAVNPTGIAMSLRGDLAAAATMRAYLIGTTEFSQDSNGDESLAAAPVAYDVTWGSWTSLASANYATQYQFQFLPVEMVKLSSFTGALVLVDASGTAALNGLYVDILRYGVL
jgi:hypothetical protein